ncbi:Ferredoxin [Lachnospiraceae bacterium TWA4]|nr:Ferredoxin [Lachnospiraceae bacterium TWA4]
MKRRVIQLICAVLYNCNFTGFARGKIYKGDTKAVCVPGLNCYSCPGAVASCPIGSLQSALVSSRYQFPYYILGVLLLFGILFGRVVCGFLCPFGLLQDLLYKIPTPKIKKGKWSKILSYLKYLILIVFVIGIPILLYEPGFCKYICPAGTLEAGIPLVAMNEPLQELAGNLFIWKTLVLVIILIAVTTIFRSFCRFICPLGAFYSLFHKIAFLRVAVNEHKCNHCGVCVRTCKMDVQKVGDRECIQCGECKKKCSQNAICGVLEKKL